MYKLFKLVPAKCIMHTWLIAFCTVKWNRIACWVSHFSKTWGRVYLRVGNLDSWTRGTFYWRKSCLWLFFFQTKVRFLKRIMTLYLLPEIQSYLYSLSTQMTGNLLHKLFGHLKELTCTRLSIASSTTMFTNMMWVSEWVGFNIPINTLYSSFRRRILPVNKSFTLALTT